MDMTNNTNPADRDINTYAIKNSNGLSGGVWGKVFSDSQQAADAIATAYGWDAAILGPTMTDSIGDDGEEEIAWCVYGTQEECDADATGAHAPRVVRVVLEDASEGVE